MWSCGAGAGKVDSSSGEACAALDELFRLGGATGAPSIRQLESLQTINNRTAAAADTRAYTLRWTAIFRDGRWSKLTGSRSVQRPMDCQSVSLPFFYRTTNIAIYSSAVRTTSAGEHAVSHTEVKLSSEWRRCPAAPDIRKALSYYRSEIRSPTLHRPRNGAANWLAAIRPSTIAGSVCGRDWSFNFQSRTGNNLMSECITTNNLLPSFCWLTDGRWILFAAESVHILSNQRERRMEFQLEKIHAQELDNINSSWRLMLSSWLSVFSCRTLIKAGVGVRQDWLELEHC